jgi:Protein of unknown function (DUF2917)
MRVKFTDESYTITAKTALSGKVSQPRNLQIESGRVWLTVEGEPDDHWLGAGDVFSLPAHRLIVIEADQQASRIQFKESNSAASPMSNLFKWINKDQVNTCQA